MLYKAGNEKHPINGTDDEEGKTTSGWDVTWLWRVLAGGKARQGLPDWSNSWSNNTE